MNSPEILRMMELCGVNTVRKEGHKKYGKRELLLEKTDNSPQLNSVIEIMRAQALGL